MASAKRAFPTCASTKTYLRYMVYVRSAENTPTGRKRVIEDDDIGVVIQGASNVDALLLPTTQVDTLLADLRASPRLAPAFYVCIWTNLCQVTVREHLQIRQQARILNHLPVLREKRGISYHARTLLADGGTLTRSSSKG